MYHLHDNIYQLKLDHIFVKCSLKTNEILVLITATTTWNKNKIKKKTIRSNPLTCTI